MSYELDGVYYSSHAARERARKKRDKQRAENRKNALQQEVNRQRRAVRENESALRQARGDYQQQLRLNEQISGRVEDLRRSQNRLRADQRAMRKDMDRNFAEVRQQIDATQEDLATLEREHEQHVREVEQQFAEMERELQEGLDEAEARRQETERILREEVRQVDEKVEADRRERLARAKSELDRADALVRMVEEDIVSHESRAAALDLESDLVGIREGLATARRLHQQGDAPTALAAAESAYASARQLRWKHHRNDAKLHQAKAGVKEKLAYFRKQMGDERIGKYFDTECKLADEKMRQLEEELPDAYQRYAALEVEGREHGKVLEKLEREVQLMTEHAPDIDQQFEQREQRVGQLLRALSDVCGPMTEKQIPTFKNENDPKSTRIVRCSYAASGKLDLHVPLDETEPFQVEGFDHDSNRDCKEVFERVATRLQGEAQIMRTVSDETVRAQPRLREQRRQGGWEGMGDRLRDV